MIGSVVHRFVRNPNHASTAFNRVSNRSNPFKNTMTVLEDPANDRKLFLIGSTHSSTVLANRTKELIAKEKPDTVFLQTNNEWIKLAKNLHQINSQEELNFYNNYLRQAYKFNMENNPRTLMFKARLYPWLILMNLFKGFPEDFHPFIPGLEMKFAMEEAEKLKSNIVLGGLELDDLSLTSLKRETRMDIFPLILRFMLASHTKYWHTEYRDHYAILSVNGGEAFAESMDRYRLNWFIKYFQKIAPLQKKIFIDEKNVELFYSLYRKCKGKKIVAVVNQWHMPGIEAHWRHTTNTETKKKPINPVGDMDIDTLMENNAINDKLREITSRLSKSEPATWQNYITHYHKDVQEPERTRHVQFYGYDDPDMYHGLPYGEHHLNEAPTTIQKKKK